MRALANLRIGSKILTAFSVLVLTTFAVNAIIYLNISFTRDANEAVRHVTRTVEALEALRDGALEQQNAIRALLITGNHDHIRAFEAHRTGSTPRMRPRSSWPQATPS